MLDYASLSALAAIVREGSFERAATALGVTPSAISQRLKLLEERLGTVLVVREQPCRATAVGARLCAHVEQVRLMESEMVGELPSILGQQAEERPTIRIAVNSDSLNTWFPAALTSFSEKTGALFDLVLEDEGHTAERLRSGEVLAAVTADPTPVQGCRTVALGALRYLAVASPAYVARHFPRGVDEASLQAAPVLRYDRMDHLQARWARDHCGVNLASPRHWVPSTQAFIDLTLAGFAWGMNPEMLAAPYVKSGRLVELLPGKVTEVRLYWQASRVGARLLEALTGDVQRAARKVLRQV